MPTVSLNLQLVLLTVLGKNSGIKLMSAEDGSEKSNFAQVMAFRIKQDHSCLWLEMLSCLIQSGHGDMQGVRYLPGDQQIWSGSESYLLPSKSCDD